MIYQRNSLQIFKRIAPISIMDNNKEQCEKILRLKVSKIFTKQLLVND